MLLAEQTKSTKCQRLPGGLSALVTQCERNPNPKTHRKPDTKRTNDEQKASEAARIVALGSRFFRLTYQ